MRHPRWFLSLSLCAPLIVGCGDEAATANPPAADAGADVAADAPATVQAVRVLVDSNRDGTVDEADFATRDAFTATSGAALLANVDDDDGDHAVDAEDEVVNGDADAQDLARIVIPAWRDAPAGATGALTVEAANAMGVRLFRQTGEGWALFDPAAPVDAAAIHQGITLGIESRDFPSPEWDGTVTLTWVVSNGGAELGRDRAVMRTAPWVMSNSLDHTLGVFAVGAPTWPEVTAFTQDLESATTEAGMGLTLVNGLARQYREAPNIGPDVWMQDFVEFGWTGIPAAGGGVHAMHVALRTPNPTRLMATWTNLEFLAPDRGWVWKHGPTRQTNHDPSLDSFGDLELLPPHATATAQYPLGRIVHGFTDRRTSDVELRRFLSSQGVQGPVVQLDTSWLHVGHVDEFMSFVPAPTPRGWKLLVGSPRAARELLQSIVDRDPANRAALMFQGQYWFYPEGHPMEFQPYRAQRTLGAILDDADLMAFNQQTQAHIDAQREILQREAGLDDDEVVEIPFLFWEIERGLAGAYMPGTVNLLYFDGNAVAAVPHGPIIANVDPVAEDFAARLAPYSVHSFFAEQWDILHAAGGEVHCGTNALRAVPTSTPWWGIAR